MTFVYDPKASFKSVVGKQVIPGILLALRKHSANGAFQKVELEVTHCQNSLRNSCQRDQNNLSLHN